MEKKKKNEKKPIVDFDKIDITTATDDDIIKSGLKKNVTSDYICYGIMAFIVVLMLLPPALWIFNPKPITEEDREIVYTELSCRRALSRDGYSLSINLVSHYRETFVTDAEIIFSYKKTDPDAADDYIFAEINEMESLDFKEVKSTKEINKEANQYKYNINFKDNYDKLVENETLKAYSYVPNAEIQYLTNMGYYCFSENETKNERVYIDTGEKVE